MIQLEIEGDDELASFSKNLRAGLSPTSLLPRAMTLAQQSGVIILKAAMQACMEAIYAHPNFPSLRDITPSSLYDPNSFGGNWEERTNALLDAHVLKDQGLVQIVEIDPDAEAVDPHSGRELVIDYAIPVHEGYTQWVMGKNTGVFHPGRFWFDLTAIEVDPVIAAFIMTAMEEVIIELIGYF